MTTIETTKEYLSKHGIFLLFLFVAGLLRFAFIDVQGLSHDELSAWNRIGDYDSFSEMLRLGVLPDMHPAFMQVLLQYWVKIFGDSAFAMRIPSTLFGMAAILLLYRLGIRFFNQRVGLIASLLLMFPVFSILHTTLARPYAPGLFFIMLLLYGVFRLEDSRVKSQYTGSSLLIILGATGAIYTHYYAGFSAGILGIAALYYVRTNRWVYLILSGFISMVLFLPHWHITKEHLSRDGLGWLGKPKLQWLVDYFVTYFNSSGWIILFVLIVLVLAGILNRFTMSHKARFLFLAFLSIYFLSHLVSWFYTPILREPGVLMFTPLLFLSFADWFKEWPRKNFKIWLLTIFSGFGYHSVYNAGLFQIKHFEPFREMVDLIQIHDDKYGRENMLRFCNVTDVNYLNYYARKTGANLDFELTLIEEIEEIHELARWIEKTEKEYVMLARTNRAQNVIQLEIIQNKFPKQEVAHYFFNANFNIWSRGDFSDRHFLKEFNPANQPEWFANWNSDTTKNEFIGDLKIPVSTLRREKSYLLLKSIGWIEDSATSLNFVVVGERNGEIVSQGESSVLYQAWDQLALQNIHGNRCFYTAIEIPEKLKDSDELHVYFWNRNFAQVKIEKPRIYVVPWGD